MLHEEPWNATHVCEKWFSSVPMYDVIFTYFCMDMVVRADENVTRKGVMRPEIFKFSRNAGKKAKQ